MNFWRHLQKPILVLAPMADVTDAAFRRIIAKYGKPDVLWTEFVSADGLFLGGYDALIRDLEFTQSERPIVAQFFTSRPDMMRKAASLARDLGFDGVDINMGCPDKRVERRGAGASLIRHPQLAQAIIRAAKEGAGTLPVSVKTRTGWNDTEQETLLPALLEAEPAMITIHARTRKELSLVPARWEHIARAVEIRNEKGSATLIFGNGDVSSVADALQKARETGCDGVMIGRGALGNPWIFGVNGRGRGQTEPTPLSLDERKKVLRHHFTLVQAYYGEKWAVRKFQKHVYWYTKGLRGCASFHSRLSGLKDKNGLFEAIDSYFDFVERRTPCQSFVSTENRSVIGLGEKVL
jgi:nifR3 family TIM-barrel protein